MGKELIKEHREIDSGFIEANHKLLIKNRGIIALEPMDSERRKLIHGIVDKYSDMVSFSIGAEPNRQVVLRYKKDTNEYVDIRKLVNDGKEYYKKGHYEECIKTYLDVLQFREPKASSYARIGMAYSKLDNKDMAVMYLKVAMQVSIKEGRELDFTQIIAVLEGKVCKGDRKPYFKMNEDNFRNDLHENYGIENLDEIISYIFGNNLDVEVACRDLGVPSEQVNIVRLICAKKYYSQGNYSMGDIFVRTAEKSKNKTPFTLRLLDEVRRNKKFYINRVVDTSKPLKLTLEK